MFVVIRYVLFLAILVKMLKIFGFFSIFSPIFRPDNSPISSLDFSGNASTELLNTR